MHAPMAMHELPASAVRAPDTVRVELYFGRALFARITITKRPPQAAHRSVLYQYRVNHLFQLPCVHSIAGLEALSDELVMRNFYYK